MTAPTVTIEFDGPVLDVRSGGGKWVPTRGAIETLNRLVIAYSVAVITHRSPRVVAEWLESQGVATTVDVDAEAWKARQMVLVTDRWMPGAHISRRAAPWQGWDEGLRAVRRLTGSSLAASALRAVRRLTGA